MKNKRGIPFYHRGHRRSQRVFSQVDLFPDFLHVSVVGFTFGVAERLLKNV
jgi:hypothetical protein